MAYWKWQPQISPLSKETNFQWQYLIIYVKYPFLDFLVNFFRRIDKCLQNDNTINITAG